MPKKEIAKYVLEGACAVFVATMSVYLNDRFAKSVSAKLKK